MSSTERLTMWGVVAASAAGGALAHAHPTGSRPADVVLTAAFAGLVSLTGAYARRFAWLITAGVAVAASSGGVGVAFAVAAVFIGFVAVALNARSLGMGAAAAGLAIQALLRMPHFLVQGAPSVLTAIAIASLFASAYRYAPGRARRRTRRFALYGGAACIALLGLAVVAGFLAKSHVEDGISQAQAGFDAVQHGDHDTAVAELNSSASSFGDAADALGAWWAAPARILPIAGQQMVAVKTMADEGQRLATQAAQAASVIDYEKLRVKGGAIDISLLHAVQDPITNTSAALDVAERELNGIAVDWLLPPIRDRFDSLDAQIKRARPTAALARQVIAIAPQMLGETVPQHYLVLFGSPSETRELGGFVSNFAEVTADKGKLSLTRSGRALDVSDANGHLGWTLTPGDYQQPFLPYRVTQFFGNVSASPNFPDSANVAEQLFPQAGGDQLDGVIYMDPYALQSLLELTGPISLKDSTAKLTSKNAAHTLLVDQYTQIPDKRGRVDFLDEASRVTFEKLTAGDLPKPVTVANTMSPMVDQGHLFAQSTHPEVQALYQQLALDGAVAAPKNSDYLSVTQSNENPSKIDAYLQRDITYDATFWPDTGQVDGTLRIRLTNSAPAALLPNDVIGNAKGLPPGTNHLLLTIYSSLGAKGVTINDAAAALASSKRFGLSAYTVSVDVPPGGTVTVQVTLAGVLARARQYQLTVVRQPTVNPDHIDVTLTGKQGWKVVSFPGFQLDHGTGKASIGPGRAEILTAHLDSG